MEHFPSSAEDNKAVKYLRNPCSRTYSKVDIYLALGVIPAFWSQTQCSLRMCN